MRESPDHSIELVSFKICPFVQRSVIALKEKNIDFKISYIDLKNPPDWFHEISPLGKVPVLKVDDSVLFESAVISEFLDEVYEPRLHPDSPLEKAIHRAWVEVGSELLGAQYRMLSADNEEGFQRGREELKAGLQRMQTAMAADGPFFSGSKLALIDTALAPLFMRLAIVDKRRKLDLFDAQSRLGEWSAALLESASVKESVVDDFEELLVRFFQNMNSFAMS
ncbi:MAG: glutathione S-transferase family protein [Gammaproteobacteria bacterium]|nr:glutathione S-transferase family protein [Gammaproteobacteria bacterium]